MLCLRWCFWGRSSIQRGVIQEWVEPAHVLIDQPWKLWTSCHFPFMNSSIGIDFRWKACASTASLKDRTKRGNKETLRTAYGTLDMHSHQCTQMDTQRLTSDIISAPMHCTSVAYAQPSLTQIQRQTPKPPVNTQHIHWHIHLTKWPSAVWDVMGSQSEHIVMWRGNRRGDKD